jgi:hypothetical protein
VVAAAPAARPRPSNGVRSVAAHPTVAIGAPASAAAAPVHEPALDPGPAPAPSPPAPSAAAAAPAHRPLKPKSKSEPKLEFRLIDEIPAGFERAPETQRRAALPASP